MMFRRLAGFVLVSVMVGCGSSAKAPAASAAPSTASGPAVPVTACDVEQLVRVLDEAKGVAPVVLNFWATWCVPCVSEMPVLIEFHRAYASKGVRLISVSVDHPDTIEDRVKPFVLKHMVPFPVLVLTERSPEAVAQALHVDWSGAVPATFVFDPSGRLVKAWFEEIAGQDLAATINGLHWPYAI